jgi:hypothetical protein
MSDLKYMLRVAAFMSITPWGFLHYINPALGWVGVGVQVGGAIVMAAIVIRLILKSDD